MLTVWAGQGKIYHTFRLFRDPQHWVFLSPNGGVYWTNHTSVQLTHLTAGTFNAFSNLTGRGIHLPYRGAVACASKNLSHWSLILFDLFFPSSFLSLILALGCISLLCATEELCVFPYIVYSLDWNAEHHITQELRLWDKKIKCLFLS